MSPKDLTERKRALAVTVFVLCRERYGFDYPDRPASWWEERLRMSQWTIRRAWHDVNWAEGSEAFCLVVADYLREQKDLNNG